MIISPSLLSSDFLNLEREIRAFKDIEGIWLHLDIMDGHFVPNLTFGHDIVRKISSLTDIPLDAHFMVSNPEFYIDTFKEMDLHNFTFHLEATEDCPKLIRWAKKFYTSVGVSIKPSTPSEALTDEILSLTDLVLIMSVEPGFGGQSFIESSYTKINALNSKKYAFDFVIQVDGGVSNQNAAKLTSCGVDNLVAGSYIFRGGAEHYKQKSPLYAKSKYHEF